MIKNNFLTNVSKKTVLIFVSLWAIGSCLSILAMTNLFTESILQNKYSTMLLLLGLSTAAVAKLVSNYFSNRK